VTFLSVLSSPTFVALAFVGEAAQPANLDKGPEIDKGSRLRQRPAWCFLSIFVVLTFVAPPLSARRRTSKPR